MESVRHCRLSRRHRLSRRALWLVCGGGRDRSRPCHCGLSRAPEGHGRARDAAHGVHEPGSAHRIDGHLHLRQPIDPRRAGDRAFRGRAGGQRKSSFHRARCCPVRATAACSRPAGGRSPGRNSTYRAAELRLSRRQLDQLDRSSLCLHVRLSLGRRRMGRTSLITIARSISRATPLRAHLGRCASPGTDTTSKSFRFGDLDYRAGAVHRRSLHRSPPLNAEQEAAVAPPWTHAALACRRAHGGGREPRVGSLLAAGGATPRHSLARPRPLGRDEQATRRSRRQLRARRLSARTS